MSLCVAVFASACNASESDRSSDASTTDGAAVDAITIFDRAEQAPSWAVGYGAEFWRDVSKPADGVSAGIDVGAVVERVSHAIKRPEPSALPRVNAATFTATFDGRGLQFSPHRTGASADQPPHLAPLPRTSAAVPDPATEVRLRTARVSLGDHELYRDAEGVEPWAVVGNTAQGLLDAGTGLVAHAEVRAEGVELAWVLRERPAHRGDLVVDLDVEGLAFAAQTDDGVHYADPSGVARVRISSAVLVDARGERWPIATELVDGEPRWRVPADILSTASFPIALDPTIGPELGLGSPVIFNALGDQTEPSIAASATGFLVAWTNAPGGATEIIGARVSPSGTIRDLAGIPISTAGFNEYQPSVTSNGTDYFVVWTDARGNDADIYGARVSAAGEVPAMDANGIAISTATGTQFEPSVAFNGTDYFVAWSDVRSNDNYDIYGTRVSASGIVHAPAGIPITTATNHQYKPSVASNGTDYFVAWSDVRTGTSYDIYGTRVSAAGAPAHGGIPISAATNHQIHSSIASNGTDYFVAWTDARSGTNDIYGARVSAAGAVFAADADGIPISTAIREQAEPSVASNGTDYFVAWQDARNATLDIFGARVSAAGAVPAADANGIAISTATNHQYKPAVASIGTDYFVAWQDPRNATSDIYGARVSAAGAVNDVDGVVISLERQAVGKPEVAASTSGYLVVWAQGQYPNSDVYGARISLLGAILDVNGIQFASAPAHETQPSVASNGTDYVVVWSEYRSEGSADIYGALIYATSTGPGVDIGGIPISVHTGHQDQPSIVSNGTDYFVAWTDVRSGSYDIYGARVSATGTVPNADMNGIPISAVGFAQLKPSVASNGIDYFVAWEDNRNDDNYDIYGARVTATGAVPAADANGIHISAAPNQQYEASVASNGIDYFVAWADARSIGSSRYDIYGARVSAAGAVPAGDAAGIPISTAAGDQGSPSVASNGTDFFVVWSGLTASSSDIYGAHVSAAGVADVNGLPIATSLANETLPAVAGRPGQYLVAYLSRMRIGARFVSDCGNGTLESGESCDDADLEAGDGCSATCAIEPGYACTGAPSVCVDIDECSVNNGGCDVLTTCTNTPGARTCGACPTGYTGTGATGCVDIDECSVNNGGCDVLTTCTNTPGARTCGACPSGYTGTGATGCIDIDECSVNNGGCDVLTACTNTPGARTCGACPSGYTGTGTTGCVDIDECSVNNGGCAAGVTCTNTPGSFMCGACPAGYTGDGTSCTDVDECAANNGGCDELTTCTNTPGSRNCGACPQGYSGSGDTACTDVDECALGTASCAPEATCTNTPGGFTCACPDGSEGDGDTCTALDVADSGCGCQSTDPRQASLVVLVLAICLRPRRCRQRA